MIFKSWTRSFEPQRLICSIHPCYISLLQEPRSHFQWIQPTLNQAITSLIVPKLIEKRFPDPRVISSGQTHYLLLYFESIADLSLPTTTTNFTIIAQMLIQCVILSPERPWQTWNFARWSLHCLASNPKLDKCTTQNAYVSNQPKKTVWNLESRMFTL